MIKNKAYRDFIFQVDDELYNRELKMAEFSGIAFDCEARYYKVHSGANSPSIDTLQKIADALDMELVIKLEARHE